MASRVRIRRAYDPPGDDDGYRVLVDRLWPRGIRKEDLRIDEWAREVAPSKDLRRWFGHREERWEEFQRRYREELRADEARERLDALVERARREPLTLVLGARDVEHSNAAVLQEVIEERLS